LSQKIGVKDLLILEVCLEHNLAMVEWNEEDNEEGIP